MVRVLVLLLLLGGTATADERSASDEGLAGIEALTEALREQQPGRLLKVELEHEHGQILYEVKLLTDDGRVVKLKLDARTLQVVERRAGRHRDQDDEEHDD